MKLVKINNCWINPDAIFILFIENSDDGWEIMAKLSSGQLFLVKKWIKNEEASSSGNLSAVDIENRRVALREIAMHINSSQ